ncbi:MAG: AAA family ATPase, partial [Candidatus Dormibacteraceae bacterium]
LEDLRTEIEPRLDVLRVQAAAAREASEASARLELLRGSIVWEEWREARDAYRRATSQVQGLERRLVEARELAQAAETEFQAWRAEIQAVQERRLARQRNLGRLRLEVAEAEHAVRLAEERALNTVALAEAARREEADNQSFAAAAEAIRSRLTIELEQARGALETVPEVPQPPEAPVATEVQSARRVAEQARRSAAAAASNVTALRTRREFLEEQAARIDSMTVAAKLVPDAEALLERTKKESDETESAAVMVARLRSELEGLDSLRPEPAPGLQRLCDVLTAEPGYEAALSAVLGPLVDALVARDATAAINATSDRQQTVLFPIAAPEPRSGSLFAHVRCHDGYEDIARRLLGHVVVGEEVTREGVYREPGMVRAGSDPRVAIDVRRRELREKTRALEPQAAGAAGAAKRLRDAEAALADLRARSAGVAGSEETARLLESARAAEADEVGKLTVQERLATAAEEQAAVLARNLEASLEAIGEGRAAAHHAELDRARWRDRIEDLRRQLTAAGADLVPLQASAEERTTRVANAQAAAVTATEALPTLSAAAESARATLVAAEQDSPEDDAEMAEGARRLVALEEARIDARLKAGTLGGNLELIAREAELLQARMEEIRTRMPDGVAPEEIPGGKGREREMRTLERRLEEIGPTNALAESEYRELEERFETLRAQLDDIAAARGDLEQLIAKLRAEEESRYEAVFGAVAANFHEYFSQLAPGGRATLKHADGDDGPRTGVEILVQPARKRLQNVTLLSSGERSLAALALVLALDEVNPSPFTVLDEVDAALDDANVGRFGDMLARLGAQRQFLVITHNHVTMSHASSLYGIHLDESGSSHLVSVRLEDIRKPVARAANAAHAS